MSVGNFLKGQILLVAILGLSSCGFFRFEQPTVEPQPTTERPQILAAFEQKIAQQLLAKAPQPRIITTNIEAVSDVASLDNIINHSGINIALLDSSTRSEFQEASTLLKRTRFQVAHWAQLNHLSDLQQLSHSKDIQNDLKKFTLNINDPSIVKVRYPRLLVDAAKKILGTDSITSTSLPLLNFNTATDTHNWAKRRVDLFLTAEQQQDTLASLESSFKTGKLELDVIVNSNGISLTDLYRDPYFNVGSEANPEQSILDLFALHVEEALSNSTYRQAVSIQGVEQNLFSLFLSDAKSLDINLTELKSLPAFEYQSLAYHAAGELFVNDLWAQEWRQTAGLAVALKLGESIFEDTNQTENSANSSFQQSVIGNKVQKQLQLFFAIAEIKLALGKSDLDSIQHELFQHFPYTKAQANAVLLNWFASRGSFATGSYIHMNTTELTLRELVELVGGDHPENLQALLSRANNVAGQQ